MAEELPGLQTELSRENELARLREENARLRAEREIERDNFHRLFEQSSNYVAVIKGPDFVYEYSNPTHQLVVGTNPVGRRVLDAVPDMGPSGALELIERVYRTGEPVVLENVAIQIEGQLHYFEGNYVARRDRTGKVDAVIALGVDVTEQIVSRKKLEKSEELLHKAVTVAKVGFYDWDVQADRIIYSRQMREDWQIEPTTTLAEALSRIHPEDRARVQTLIAESIASAQPFHCEYRVIRINDRDVIWVEAQGVITYDEGGKPVRFFGTSRDITEAKRARERIDSSERQLALVTSAIPVLICYLDTEERYLFVNTAYAKWFQCRCEDLIGVRVEDFVGPVVYEKSRGYLARALAGETVEFEHESRYQTGARHIRAVYTPDIDEKGQVRGVVALVHDVTDQVKARKTLEEDRGKILAAALELSTEQGKLSAMIAQSPAGVALMRGPNFVFEKINSKWKELVSPREYLGRTWKEIYPELADSELYSSIVRVFETGESFVRTEMKIHLRGPDGEFEDRFYDFGYFRVLNGHGEPYGLYCHAADVTERVATRAELESKVAELGLEKEIRERFVATLTHDLRTPLTVARMSAQLLVRKPGDVAAVHKMSDRIIRGIDRADRMVRDLLDANRLKAGEGIPISVEEVRLTPIFDRATGVLETVNGPRFDLFNEVGDLTGYWDAEALQRVIENLGSNAVKYGAEAAPITITLRTIDRDVEIAVHNHGVPIASEDQVRLFDSYRRSDSAIQSGKKGWGIGLTLVKGIVTAHGGSVRVESDEKRGTTFYVRLPIDARPAT